MTARRIMVMNLREAFLDYAIAIPVEPFYLWAINFVQQLFSVNDFEWPPLPECRQHMEVDSIQIVEAKKQ